MTVDVVGEPLPPVPRSRLSVRGIGARTARAGRHRLSPSRPYPERSVLPVLPVPCDVFAGRRGWRRVPGRYRAPGTPVCPVPLPIRPGTGSMPLGYRVIPSARYPVREAVNCGYAHRVRGVPGVPRFSDIGGTTLIPRPPDRSRHRVRHSYRSCRNNHQPRGLPRPRQARENDGYG